MIYFFTFLSHLLKWKQILLTYQKSSDKPPGTTAIYFQTKFYTLENLKLKPVISDLRQTCSMITTVRKFLISYVYSIRFSNPFMLKFTHYFLIFQCALYTILYFLNTLVLCIFPQKSALILICILYTILSNHCPCI